ncbi:Cupredoxin-like domain-containing protein [Colwellia chukchiensis]|uniref:Cupredoxin-like domain-containing protein n=1 Tax=Colwellia chukchiensis TaxID=641665 RepID=A0A1H7NEH0_9GAMM|nr:cupredoxin domain-containing protein [Colwellia chukchiensis]SEL21317.1 Cupredoxin-like domain-containing protein [Colwellia chukchiensis]
MTKANVANTTVVVKGGSYQPSRIRVASGKQTRLKFPCKDASPCAATVLFPDFEISEDLPMARDKFGELPAMLAGEYTFHCPMKRSLGSLIVE